MQGIKRKEMIDKLTKYPYCEVFGWTAGRVCRTYKWDELKQLYDKYINQILGVEQDKKVTDLDYQWFN